LKEKSKVRGQSMLDYNGQKSYGVLRMVKREKKSAEMI
jgi:hypothetical protein